MNLQEAIAAITPERVNAILAGTPFNFEQLQQEQQNEVVTAAIHCCSNGPVSVHKETNIPGIEGRRSIDGIVGHRITNSQWAAFCRPFAEHLQQMGLNHIPWVRQTGQPWPLGQRN